MDWLRAVGKSALTLAALAASLSLPVHASGQTPAQARTQLKAQVRSGATPTWTKGILPISPESYYHAIECGKQGGDDPPCVFYDTGLCKNDDFTLALYTPYKSVAYEVWRVVREKQPAPTPSYPEAQRTHITVGITQVRGAKNGLTEVILKRGGRTIQPRDRSVGGGGRFTYDYPAFAATMAVTLDLVGQNKTISCLIEQPVLAQLR